MKLNHIIVYCVIVFCSLQTDLYAQRIIYANEACDSVQIDFALRDIYGRNYKIRNVQISVGNRIYPALNLSRNSEVDIIIPTKLFNQHKDSLVIKVFHKTDKSQDFTQVVKNMEVCTGLCCIHVIQMQRSMLDKYEGGGTRTILAEDIQKGAW